MQVSVRELENRLSEYLRRVQDGGESVVTSHGKPVARMVDPGHGGGPIARTPQGSAPGRDPVPEREVEGRLPEQDSSGGVRCGSSPFQFTDEPEGRR
jgi:prevent-host-death family protein